MKISQHCFRNLVVRNRNLDAISLLHSCSKPNENLNRPRGIWGIIGTFLAFALAPPLQYGEEYSSKFAPVYLFFNMLLLSDTRSLLSLICVGFLWGATNPLFKKSSDGIEKVKGNNIIARFFNEVIFLCTNFKVLLPFLLNQSGSLIYFYTLQNVELTLAVPIANSLSFVFTALSGYMVGEAAPNKCTMIGSCLIIAGVFCYVLDKN